VDGTAFDKADYKPQNKVSKTFVPGQVYMKLSVEIVDDETKEKDEAFSVKIGSYTQTTVTQSGDKCVLITIKDNDPGTSLMMTSNSNRPIEMFVALS
jgi:hypothetical protein